MNRYVIHACVEDAQGNVSRFDQQNIHGKPMFYTVYEVRPVTVNGRTYHEEHALQDFDTFEAAVDFIAKQ